jgi:hypothetical protein
VFSPQLSLRLRSRSCSVPERLEPMAGGPGKPGAMRHNSSASGYARSSGVTRSRRSRVDVASAAFVSEVTSPPIEHGAAPKRHLLGRGTGTLATPECATRLPWRGAKRPSRADAGGVAHPCDRPARS